ncbi:hypothetical protein [Streptomyces sp. CAU 1734]|uniref:hypothetical protein n=1 Tax=Streptomyces sp. CAU 1734 TaxID=3140360 RepID=UPI0032603AC4
MHRTTTTARTVAGMAVWAVSGLTLLGCVAVEPLPGPAIPGGRPAPASESRVIQGPGREALTAPPGGPASAAPAGAPPERTAAGREHRPPAPRNAERPAVRPAPPAPRARAKPPRLPLPRITPAAPDVCGLSEAYGGWRPGSPQSNLCRKASREVYEGGAGGR